MSRIVELRDLFHMNEMDHKFNKIVLIFLFVNRKLRLPEMLSGGLGVYLRHTLDIMLILESVLRLKTYALFIIAKYFKLSSRISFLKIYLT